jgi:hypothetical protein
MQFVIAGPSFYEVHEVCHTARKERLNSKNDVQWIARSIAVIFIGSDSHPAGCRTLRIVEVLKKFAKVGRFRHTSGNEKSENSCLRELPLEHATRRNEMSAGRNYIIKQGNGLRRRLTEALVNLVTSGNLIWTRPNIRIMSGLHRLPLDQEFTYIEWLHCRNRP